ncbi:hypothetical protein [Streptomyces sulfonofaciens]|uniref:hypothetical protein n=1 Tax=Streptomyces sulfonofaciens TaxID=68272 RepID=UPI001675772E|nr:hypothetical protein [Streptomyces sulfonofaciens]
MEWRHADAPSARARSLHGVEVGMTFHFTHVGKLLWSRMNGQDFKRRRAVTMSWIW